MTATDPAVEPDTKDWTWVLEQPCAECGYDASSVETADLGARLRRNADPWPVLLSSDGATRRPRPGVWSVLEYACHVRDVHRVFDERVRLMLDRVDPQFASWDQDAAAVEERYHLSDPAVVGRQLVDAAAAVATRYDAVAPEDWGRAGRRSNGSVFTVASLGRYHLHDVVHHLHDVG